MFWSSLLVGIYRWCHQKKPQKMLVLEGYDSRNKQNSLNWENRPFEEEVLILLTHRAGKVYVVWTESTPHQFSINHWSPLFTWSIGFIIPLLHELSVKHTCSMPNLYQMPWSPMWWHPVMFVGLSYPHQLVRLVATISPTVNDWWKTTQLTKRGIKLHEQWSKAKMTIKYWLVWLVWLVMNGIPMSWMMVMW